MNLTEKRMYMGVGEGFKGRRERMKGPRSNELKGDRQTEDGRWKMKGEGYSLKETWGAKSRTG
jgi:hypothetical protein